ncbi:MAG: ribosomal protein S18-alanine N-acetyltransferase [Clostridia bacterium]|nr:ribosomal protein S18-alanine N-acetyltransferase [Clostridia bacterium]
MAEISLRRMTVEDVDAVHAIEEATFAKPWSRQSFYEEMTRNACARYLVAVTEAGEIVGFAGVWVVLDEGHITNIAVRADHRGQGIGKLLTTGLMQYAANLGVIYMTLEVRRSNLVAQHLYLGHGFIQVGVRKRYYEDNGEDALFMVCDHLPPADPDFEEPETVRE